MDKDAAILNLNYRELEEVKDGILGLGGKSRGWLPKGITLTFNSINSADRIETLETILVSKHAARNEARRIQINRVPSLLGLDILSKTRITFDALGAMIEFPPFDSNQIG